MSDAYKAHSQHEHLPSKFGMSFTHLSSLCSQEAPILIAKRVHAECLNVGSTYSQLTSQASFLTAKFVGSETIAHFNPETFVYLEI